MENRLRELVTESRQNRGAPSEKEIAEILSEEFGRAVTKNAVHGKIWRNDIFTSLAPTTHMPLYTKYKDSIHDCKISNDLTDLDLSGKKKILHLSDLHVPFHNRSALESAVNMHATADILVVSEIADMSSQSSFVDLDSIPLHVEIEEIINVLEFLSKSFKTIVVIESNHDFRLARRFAKALPEELQLLVDEFNIIQLLSRPFNNIFVVRNWWVQIGDAIFCHGSKASSVSMKTVCELDYYFKDNFSDLGVRIPYGVIVQAHTHHLGVVYKPRLKLFESGMMCQLREWYTNKPTKTQWVTGCVVVEMLDGVSILNKCREYVFDSESESYTKSVW